MLRWALPAKAYEICLLVLIDGREPTRPLPRCRDQDTAAAAVDLFQYRRDRSARLANTDIQAVPIPLLSAEAGDFNLLTILRPAACFPPKKLFRSARMSIPPCAASELRRSAHPIRRVSSIACRRAFEVSRVMSEGAYTPVVSRPASPRPFLGIRWCWGLLTWLGLLTITGIIHVNA
jgi:hypothetical protein